jgi:large subunit ribosomal protein L21
MVQPRYNPDAARKLASHRLIAGQTVSYPGLAAHELNLNSPKQFSRTARQLQLPLFIRHKPNFAKSKVDTRGKLWFHFRPFAGKFMYAVLETGGKQYRVTAGDKLEIERLDTEAGKSFTFDRVLFVGGDKHHIGAPTVSGASIIADVVEHKRGEKKLTFKMKRRKGYHKTIGHRQELTVIKIKEIKL